MALSVDVVQIGTSSGAGALASLIHPSAPGSVHTTMLVLERGPDRTAADRENQCTELATDLLDWNQGQYRMQSAMTEYGVPNLPLSNYLASILGGAGAHHGGMSVRASPEDYDAFDARNRIEAQVMGLANIPGGTGVSQVAGAIGFDPLAEWGGVPVDVWIRLKGDLTLDNNRTPPLYQITAAAAATLTIDNPRGLPLPSGVYEVLWIKPRTPLTGAITWPGGVADPSALVAVGGAFTTELEVGDGIIAAGFEARPFIVSNIIDDDNLEVENPLGLTLPAGALDTTKTSPWSRASVLKNGYNPIETDVDLGADADHGAAGPHIIGRVGAIGGAPPNEHRDQRSVGTDRAEPMTQDLVVSLRDSVLGTLPSYAWEEDANGWRDFAGSTDVFKTPLSQVGTSTTTQTTTGGTYVSGGQQTNFGDEDQVSRDDERTSDPAVIYWDDIRQDPGVTLLCNATAERILFSKEPDGTLKVEGVQYWYEEEPGELVLVTVNTNEVIVCCGAFESAALLMRSGIGPRHKMQPHGIEVLHELPGVGDGYHQHWGAFAVTVPNKPLPDVFGTIQYTARIKTSYSGGARAGEGFEVGMPPVLYDDQEDVWCLLIASGRSSIDQLGNPASWGAAAKQAAAARGVIIAFVSPYKGRSRSSGLELTGPTAFDQPTCVSSTARVQGAKEAEAIVEALDDLVSKIEDPGQPFAQNHIFLGPSVIGYPQTPVEAVQGALAAFHPGGTCRMGHPSDPYAVVDERARVMGTAGLRISDASIVPEQLRANMNLPATAHGHVIGRMILADGAV